MNRDTYSTSTWEVWNLSEGRQGSGWRSGVMFEASGRSAAVDEYSVRARLAAGTYRLAMRAPDGDLGIFDVVVMGVASITPVQL